MNILVDTEDDSELIAKVSQYWSLNITQDDVDEIRGLEPFMGLNYALAGLLSKNYTVIAWTTHGHNGETVPLWVHGADAPLGIIDNTTLAAIAADSMCIKLDTLTETLYVDLSSVTDDYLIDDTDPENLVLKVKEAELPINKDYMVMNNNIIELPALTVYAPATDKVYISKKALYKLGLL
ncbi:MAG: hypothetical protein SWO11_06680 [Thermodesulfobacteriota bacterium]|nr:hypothetical protein [Thermodesulfobacteriota bacterium]